MSQSVLVRTALASAGLVALAISGIAQTSTGSPISLSRRYKLGETVRYSMVAHTRNRGSATFYQAHADGTVKKDAAGVFFVAFTWSGLSYNGRPVKLPSTGPAVQQRLSLDPRFKLSIPDFRKVQPALIGPMADLLTFYADVQLAMRQQGLRRSGDRVYIEHPEPNSWADHVHTLIGEDTIDFDIALAGVNPKANTATLVVKHAPPRKPKLKFPAQWMRVPVADTANNWVQVVKNGSAYLAAVGKEVFTDRIVLNLDTGEIESANMNNPVQVLQKQCSDESLQNCGDTQRYWIRRHIELKLSAYTGANTAH